MKLSFLHPARLLSDFLSRCFQADLRPFTRERRVSIFKSRSESKSRPPPPCPTNWRQRRSQIYSRQELCGYEFVQNLAGQRGPAAVGQTHLFQRWPKHKGQKCLSGWLHFKKSTRVICCFLSRLLLKKARITLCASCFFAWLMRRRANEFLCAVLDALVCG